MLHRIKILSLHRVRDRADEIGTAAAAEYFADMTVDLRAHRDEPLGLADDDEPEPELDPPFPAPATDAETIQIPRVDEAGPVPGAPPWTDADVHERADALREAFVARTAPAPAAAEQLPAVRRRHLPAVGAWFAEHLRPVPLPAIPDADRYRVVPVDELAHATPQASPSALPHYRAQAAVSGRLALEAAATTEPASEQPEDALDWLRREFALLDARLDAALVEHSQTRAADLAALRPSLTFMDDHLAALNPLTLPGWTRLETALHSTGVFA